MYNIYMELIATEVPADQDPVVVVFDIGWMRELIQIDSDAFVALVDVLYNTEVYDSHDISYPNTRNGHNSDDDGLLMWESNLRKILLFAGRSVWDWIEKNVPKTVFEGYDMDIGGDDHGKHWLDMVDGVDKKLDRVVIVTTELTIQSADALVDEDKTISLTGPIEDLGEGAHISDSIIITPWVDSVVQQWAEEEDLNTETSCHIPQALYQLMKLSELRESPNSINYHTLKI